MIVLENTDSFLQHHKRCVATIGKFDGVHLGHQLILDQLSNEGGRLELPTLVILIEPHPEEFFAATPEQAPARISEVDQKLQLLESFGVDFVFKLAFDQALSQLSAQDYIESILVNGLGVASFIVGSDFRFGHNRMGDFKLLQLQGKQFDFTVLETAGYERNGRRISSTYIRELLDAGRFELVDSLLGRPYAISGEIARGKQLGAGLGFPTCNVKLPRRKSCLQGVYACIAEVLGKQYQAVANIGYRPTVTNDDKALLEVHLFDFDRNVYGKVISVVFKHKIRDEAKFSSLDALKAQIARDCEQARKFFNSPDEK